MAKSVGGGFINHGLAGHTAAALSRAQEKKEYYSFPFHNPPFCWANLEPPPIQTHTFFHTNRKGKKKEERQFPLQFSSLPPLLFFRVDFCVIFFLSLFLSPPSISRWQSQLTWRRRRKKRRKRTVVAVVSRWIFLAPCFLSLRTRDGRESARGSADQALPPSKDSFTLNTFDSPFKPDPNWKPFFLTIPIPLFCLTRVMKTKIKTTPTFRS